MYRFGISVIFIFLASAIQFIDFSFFGVKPSWVVAALLPLSVIHKNWLDRLMLVFIGVTFGSFYPDIPLLILSFVSIIVGIVIVDNLPSSRFLSIALAVCLIVFVIHSYDFSIVEVLFEALSSAILSIIIFLFLSRIFRVYD